MHNARFSMGANPNVPYRYQINDPFKNQMIDYNVSPLIGAIKNNKG